MNAEQLVTASHRSLNRPGLITVADLIERLQEMPQDAVILFASDYGDRGHTTQVVPVTEVNEMTDEQCITKTAYSDSGMAITDLSDGDAEADDFIGDAYEATGTARPQVVILR